MRISLYDPNLISIAVNHFQKGAIVIYPTETCYGLGTIGLKYNEENIRNIFKIKSRPLEKPLSLLISKKMIRKYIKTSSEIFRILDRIWPNQVTIILNCTKEASQTLSPLINLTNPQKIAFRVPNHRILLNMIDKLKIPIIGTSANKSGSKSKYDLEMVARELSSNKIQLWIDAGRLPENPPSTIVDLTSPKNPILLRKGNFAIEEYFDNLR